MPIERFKFSDLLGVFSSKKRQAEDRCHFRSDIWITVRDKYGNIKSDSFQHNLRTNAGADFWNTQLFSTSPGTLGGNRIALTTDSSAAGATDTTLPSEETANGLGRTGALTPTHSAGASSSSFSNTFTYTTSGAKVIAKVGLLSDTHANGGTLVLETLLSSTATVNTSGDTITITWTINY